MNSFTFLQKGRIAAHGKYGSGQVKMASIVMHGFPLYHKADCASLLGSKT